MSNIILHIIAPDKFTLPLVYFLNKEIPNYNQIFISISKPDDEAICALPNVFYLKNPHKKNFFRNTFLILKYFLTASKIVLHGNPVLYYFRLFPFVLKKTYWVIYGHSDLGTIESNKEKSVQNFIKKKVLKKVYGHVTHIEGDSFEANHIFGSTAKLFYSPMYLTNVIDTSSYEVNIKKQGTRNILMGNSTDPSNCHFELFEMMLPYKDEDILIFCPLSYGPYITYRDEVIKKGKELFKEKFIPLTQFMDLDAYRTFLNTIDIALFNHKSQTAMGVTTSLLAMGKVVFAHSNTTSFQSLISRGFQIFNIDELKEGKMLLDHNTNLNKDLIKKYYSIEELKKSYLNIYKNKY